MDENILKWLFDIKTSINEIESYFENSKFVFEDYKSNVMLKRAVERDIEIIGEATNRIIKLDPNYINLISESKSIVSLRNQVIHAYDNISDEKIWAILINHIPILKIEIESLLNPYL